MEESEWGSGSFMFCIMLCNHGESWGGGGSEQGMQGGMEVLQSD